MKKITKQKFIEKANKSLKEGGYAPSLLDIDVYPCDCDWEKCQGWQVVHGFRPSYNLQIQIKKIVTSGEIKASGGSGGNEYK